MYDHQNMHKCDLLISPVNPYCLPSEQKPPSTTNEVVFFAASFATRYFRGSCAKVDGKFPGAHRTIRISVNAEIDRNLKRIKIHHIYGNLVVLKFHNETVMSSPSDTHRAMDWISHMKISYGFIPPENPDIYRKTRSVSTMSLITKRLHNAQWPDHMDGAVSGLCIRLSKIQLGQTEEAPPKTQVKQNT